MKNEKRVLIFIVFLLLAYPVLGATFLDDTFGVFQGVDFGNFYLQYYHFIDAVVYLVLFVSLAQFVFKKKFEKEGKKLSVAIGTALAISMIVLEMNTGFNLTILSPIAALIFFGMLAMLLYNLLQAMFEKKRDAFALTYLIMFAFLTTVFNPLLKWIKTGSALLYGIIFIAAAVSFFIILIDLFGMFKSNGNDSAGSGAGSGADSGAGGAGGGGGGGGGETAGNITVTIVSPRAQNYPQGSSIPFIFNLSGPGYSSRGFFRRRAGYSYRVIINGTDFAHSVINNRGRRPDVYVQDIPAAWPASHYRAIVEVNTSNGVVVSPAVEFDITGGGGGRPLAVTLTASPTNGPSPLPVVFTAVASGGSGTYSGYHWYHGDRTENASTVPNSTYTYPVDGIFNATVEVIDNTGRRETSAPVPITVGRTPPPPPGRRFHITNILDHDEGSARPHVIIEAQGPRLQAPDTFDLVTQIDGTIIAGLSNHNASGPSINAGVLPVLPAGTHAIRVTAHDIGTHSAIATDDKTFQVRPRSGTNDITINIAPKTFPETANAILNFETTGPGFIGAYNWEVQYRRRTRGGTIVHQRGTATGPQTITCHNLNSPTKIPAGDYLLMVTATKSAGGTPILPPKTVSFSITSTAAGASLTITNPANGSRHTVGSTTLDPLFRLDGPAFVSGVRYSIVVEISNTGTGTLVPSYSTFGNVTAPVPFDHPGRPMPPNLPIGNYEIIATLTVGSTTIAPVRSVFHIDAGGGAVANTLVIHNPNASKPYPQGTPIDVEIETAGPIFTPRTPYVVYFMVQPFAGGTHSDMFNESFSDAGKYTLTRKIIATLPAGDYNIIAQAKIGTTMLPPVKNKFTIEANAPINDYEFTPVFDGPDVEDVIEGTSKDLTFSVRTPPGFSIASPGYDYEIFLDNVMIPSRITNIMTSKQTPTQFKYTIRTLAIRENLYVFKVVVYYGKNRKVAEKRIRIIPKPGPKGLLGDPNKILSEVKLIAEKSFTAQEPYIPSMIKDEIELIDKLNLFHSRITEFNAKFLNSIYYDGNIEKIIKDLLILAKEILLKLKDIGHNEDDFMKYLESIIPILNRFLNTKVLDTELPMPSISFDKSKEIIIRGIVNKKSDRLLNEFNNRNISLKFYDPKIFYTSIMHNKEYYKQEIIKLNQILDTQIKGLTNNAQTMNKESYENLQKYLFDLKRLSDPKSNLFTPPNAFTNKFAEEAILKEFDDKWKNIITLPVQFGGFKLYYDTILNAWLAYFYCWDLEDMMVIIQRKEFERLAPYYARISKKIERMKPNIFGSGYINDYTTIIAYAQLEYKKAQIEKIGK